MDNRPIGLFDSGVGGLTVLKEIVNLLPHEDLYYFGDTKRAPYGGLPPETLACRARELTAHLLRQNVKAVVVACGTISSVCPDVVRECGLPVVGMVEPGVRAALAAAKQSVCLLATKATVESGSHKRLLGEANSALAFHALACPAFVPIIEAGLGEDEDAYTAARQALAQLGGARPDAIILGCTHYPLMLGAIRSAAGEGPVIVNPAVEAAATLREILRQKGLLARGGRRPQRRVAVSGGADTCVLILKRLFGGALSAETVSL